MALVKELEEVLAAEELEEVLTAEELTDDEVEMRKEKEHYDAKRVVTSR